MKITHNKEHCFLAVWALQQYGKYPRVADADDENDDARGAKKKHSSRTGLLPKELVRKIVEYLIYPSSLEIEFDLGSESDVEALRGTVDFLCKAFLRQPELEVWHEPSQTMFAPLMWGRNERTPDGEEQKFIDRGSGELVTAKGEWVSLVAWPGFVGRDGAVPDWYPQAVAHLEEHERIDPANQVVMVEAVRGATVLTATEADVNDYEYYPVFRNLKEEHHSHDLAEESSVVREIYDSIDAFTRDEGHRWGQVYFGLTRGAEDPEKRVAVRNGLDFPNMDHRGTVLFANVVDDADGPMVGEDPRLRDGGLVLLRSEMSDGPPRVQEAEVERFCGGDFSVYTLIEAALKTKSHKADGWYEMYGRCKIDTTEDAVFLDLDFDYGS